MTDGVDDIEEVPDEDDATNVLPLFKKAIDKSPFPLTRASGERLTCKHVQTEYDEEERTIECRACGKPVDPFSLLVKYARNWDTIAAEQRAAQNEVDRLEAKVEERKKMVAKISRAREARAVTREIDKEMARAWLKDRSTKKDEETYAMLGRWVAQQLDGMYGTATMLLIEVIDKPKTKP